MGWLARNQIDQISIFMATMDGADNSVTEGRNATSPFFYDALRAFLDGSADLKAPRDTIQVQN